MANKYNDILTLVNAGNQMGLSNTIKRDYGIPLDFTSVQESYDAAVIYAATSTLAYVGQTVAVGSKLYIISDTAAGKHTVGEVEYDNYLAEVGSKTEGDGNTIELDGQTLKLAGLTGLDNSKTYVPSLVNGKLIWAEPDTSTAEGQAQEINGLKTSVGEIINILGDSESGLVKDVEDNSQAITDEIAAREAAIGVKASEGVESTGIYAEIDSALQAAKDYADAQDADTVYDDTALKGRVEAIENDYLKTADKYDDTAVLGRISAIEETIGDAEGGLVKDIAENNTAISTEKTRAEAAEKTLSDKIDAIDFVDPQELADAIKDFATTTYVDAEIDKIEEAISNLNHFKAEVVDSIDNVTELGILYLIKDDSVAGTDKYNEYIVVDGAPVLIGDTTTDLSNYYNKTEIDGKVTTINEAISDEVEAREALAQEVADLKAVDNATQAELDAYKTEVTEEIRVAKEAAITDADGKLANKVNSSDFETFKGENTSAIATAKQEAIDAAKSAEEAKGYAVASEVASTYATKQDLEDHENTVDATLSDYAKTSDVETELAKKIESGSIAHTSEGVAEGVTVDGTQIKIVVDSYTKAETLDKISEKITEINGGESAGEVLGELNSYKETNDAEVAAIKTKNSEQDTAIAAAQTQADKGVADAKTANDAISALTTGQVATNKNDIDAVKGRLTTLETAKGDHETRIAAAEGKIVSLETATTNNATVIGELQGKDTELVAEDARLAGLITNLQSDKANAADVYTKGEVDTKIQSAIDAIPDVDLDPYAKTEDVNAALDLKANAADVYTKTEADLAFMSETEVDARINTLIVGADPEGGKVITNIVKLVEYVDENANEIAALISATDANTAKLAGIDTTVTAYVSDALATIIQPKASDEITVATDGTLGIAQINVNKLVQTDGDELILFGGNA